MEIHSFWVLLGSVVLVVLVDVVMTFILEGFS